MKPVFHPAVFLGAVVVICAGWLWARPPVTAATTLPRSTAARPAVADPTPIALDAAILERYAGAYEGRGGFTVDLTLTDGRLFAKSPNTIAFELGATSETEFFLKGMGIDLEFDVAGDGTVRGFSADTEFGLVEVKRVR